jgi:hypothetical protein
VKYYCRKEQNIEYKHRKPQKGAVCVRNEQRRAGSSRSEQDQLWIYTGSGFSSKVLHPAKNGSVEFAE